MDNNGTAVARRDPINHIKVVVLAVLASLMIMLIGIAVHRRPAHRRRDQAAYGRASRPSTARPASACSPHSKR